MSFRGKLLALLLLFSPLVFADESPDAPKKKPLRMSLKNSGYAYNGENNGAWDRTRVTLTYFENLFQPTLIAELNPRVDFEVGAGLLIPFDQEQKVSRYYPFVQTKLKGSDWYLELGSLGGNHNFPAPLLDPLINLVPQIRLGGINQFPVTGETYPLGPHSHGRYEYGLAFLWDKPTWGGEFYFNWQLPDNTNHRERFDVGLISTVDVASLPLYAAVHYWHNGGHENPHAIAITENYTAGFGLRNETFSALYLVSFLIPDRSVSSTNVFGQALFFEYAFNLSGWVIQPQLFVSSQLIASNQQFVSVEGDPFFRVPAYLGFNIYRDWKIYENVAVRFGLVNGFYSIDTNGFNPRFVRYDQMVRIDLTYDFEL